MNAVALTGLFLYRFGETITIPFWTERWQPTSFYTKLLANRLRGLHTLCLLDIQAKERTEADLLAGRPRFQPPRFMSVRAGLEELLACSAQLSLSDMEPPTIPSGLSTEACGLSGAVTEETFAIGVARLGHRTQQIVSGPIRELVLVDFGPPLPLCCDSWSCF